MMKHHRKLLLAGKIILAAGLLTWVLSRVHYHDYVVDRQGRSWAVLETVGDQPEAPTVVVRTGWGWWAQRQMRPLNEFEPAQGSRQVIRPGLASNLRGLHPVVLAASVGAYILSLPVLAVRWLVLLNIQQVRIGLREALRLTLLGQFFNAVAPGTVGGDLAKAYYVARSTHRRAAALLSILVDRLLGLSELALLAAVMVGLMLAAGLADWPELRLPAALAGVAVAAVAAALAVVLSPRLRAALRLQRLLERLPLARQLASLSEAARAFARRPGRLVLAVAITSLAHLCWISSIWLAGLALNLPAAWYQYFLYIPLIYIIGAVPLTPGGIGLIEQFYLLFFVSAATTPSMVLALALLARLVPIVCGLPGVLVLVSGPRPPSERLMEQELGVERA